MCHSLTHHLPIPASTLAPSSSPLIGQFSPTSVTLSQSHPARCPIGRARGNSRRNFPLAEQFCGQFFLWRSWKLHCRDGQLYLLLKLKLKSIEPIKVDSSTIKSAWFLWQFETWKHVNSVLDMRLFTDYFWNRDSLIYFWASLRPHVE